MKKIIAISDLHLRTLKKHNVHKNGFKNFLLAIKNIKDIDAVVICGDLFHNKLIVSNEALSILSKFLNAITKYCKKLIIIPGNHDAVIGSDRMDGVSFLVETLNNDKIHYLKSSGCYLIDDIVFCAWSCLEHQKDPEISQWKKENDPDSKYTYVGLYHGVIQGSTTNQGFTFTEADITPDSFYETDYFLAGDIHQYQTYEYKNYKGKGFGIMVSTLLQDSFGESLDHHGYVTLTNKNGKWDHTHTEIENEHNYVTFNINSYEEIDDVI